MTGEEALAEIQRKRSQQLGDGDLGNKARDLIDEAYLAGRSAMADAIIADGAEMRKRTQLKHEEEWRR